MSKLDIRAKSSGSEPGADVSAEILRGVRMGTPIVLGYLPLGFAYGVLAVKSGIPASPGRGSSSRRA